MKNSFRTLTGFACLTALTATLQAGVIYSVDGTTTTTSAAWSGTPAIALAAPSQGNVVEGGGTGGGVVGIAFLATSSFTMGEIRFEAAGLPLSNITVSMYDLGTTTPQAANPRYTIDINSVNLLSAGLNFNYSSAASQIASLLFTGADQVALTSGHWYTIELLNNNTATNFGMERASTGLPDTFLSLGSGATGSRNNVPAGDRDPVAAIYAIPEPSSAALLGLGALVGTFVIRRRH